MQQARAVASFGALPLIVLSRGLRDGKGEVRQEQQTTLLLLSSRSQQIFADTSGHGIPTEQPKAAVAAIVQMVTQSR